MNRCLLFVPDLGFGNREGRFDKQSDWTLEVSFVTPSNQIQGRTFSVCGCVKVEQDDSEERYKRRIAHVTCFFLEGLWSAIS